MAGSWLVNGEKMVGSGVAFLYLVLMDACKLTLAHILSFRGNFQIADPPPPFPPFVLKTSKIELMFLLI